MIRFSVLKVATVGALVLLPAIASAQSATGNDNTGYGTTAAEFLLLGANARGMALGGAYSAGRHGCRWPQREPGCRGAAQASGHPGLTTPVRRRHQAQLGWCRAPVRRRIQRDRLPGRHVRLLAMRRSTRLPSRTAPAPSTRSVKRSSPPPWRRTFPTVSRLV